MLNHQPPARGRAAALHVRQSKGPYLSPLMRSIIGGALHEILGRRRTLTGSASEFLISPFSRGEQVQLAGLLLLWACTVALLFWWWFQRDHVIDWSSFAIASLALAWVVCLPAYFFFFLLRARVPNPELTIRSNWRVAM